MLLKDAGVKGQKTVFLLTDAQIKDEAFLEDVDSVLNTGEVPNLFAIDEKQEIMEVGCHKVYVYPYKAVYALYIGHFHLCLMLLFISLSSDCTSHCPGW